MASTTSLENDAGCVARVVRGCTNRVSSDTARRDAALSISLHTLAVTRMSHCLAVLVVVERHLIGKRVLQKRVLKGILASA